MPNGTHMCRPASLLRAHGVALALLAFALLVPPANAAAPAPRWTLTSSAQPTDFSPADNERCEEELSRSFPVCDRYLITATNVGAQSTHGSVTLTDTLPPGLTVKRLALFWSGLPRVGTGGEEVGGEEDLNELFGFCTTTPIRCVIPGSFFTSEHRNIRPDDTVRLYIYVTVNEPPSPTTLNNTASILGGGTEEVLTTRPNTLLAGTPTPFAFEGFRSPLIDFDGSPYTQAGGHPYQLDTQIDLNTGIRETPAANVSATSIKDPKDVVVDLPLGLAGSALSAPTCTLVQLAATPFGTHPASPSYCPAASVLGHVRTDPEGALARVNGPLYNIVPEHGVTAEFGYLDALHGTHVLYARLAPTPRGYVLRTVSPEVPQVTLTGITVNVYGDPAARDHSENAHVPTFTNPSNCSGEPLVTSIHMDSWQSPGSYNPDGTPNFSDPRWIGADSQSPSVTGCDQLHFEATIAAATDTASSDSPTGIQVNVAVPQTNDFETLGTPPLKKAVIELPQGISVNPSSANGLETCSLAQIGMSAAGEPDAAPPTCPNASRIGSVELETPALPGVLHGSVYVAQQGENPFHSLLALYIVIDDETTGVLVKLPAQVSADPVSGRLTTTVDNSPQFPFSELRTHFFGGTRAPLRTPAGCGSYSVSSELTPWSAPESGPPATPAASFDITQGPGGGPCAAQLNSPAFSAGSISPLGGAYSPFSVNLRRDDGSQELQRLNLTLPPGLVGKVAGLGRCPDSALTAAEQKSGAAELREPSCPGSSELGTVTVGAGSGPTPYYTTGRAYLAGSYRGAPFDLAVITPAVAGPYDLGTVVIRTALYIDPATAQIHAISDPFPTILQGIPLDIRSISLNVSRGQFMLNPTNCTPMAVTGEVMSITGEVAGLSSPFRVSSCSNLPFSPLLSASTQGKTSKQNGASLVVKLVQKPGESNIQKVQLQLPIALPSRLSTLQQACTEAQFNANPAACPAGSNIGTATAHTPLLDTPLTGPAYLVSHGSAAFPDVEFVLQGEGITLVVDGKTDIKKGITYSRFETVPDAPISSFEAVLPQGPHSALTANTNLCATKTITVRKRVSKRSHGRLVHTVKLVHRTIPVPLLMPTLIVGQNGASRTQSTNITVTGCTKPKPKPTHKPKKHSRSTKH